LVVYAYYIAPFARESTAHLDFSTIGFGTAARLGEGVRDRGGIDKGGVVRRDKLPKLGGIQDRLN